MGITGLTFVFIRISIPQDGTDVDLAEFPDPANKEENSPDPPDFTIFVIFL